MRRSEGTLSASRGEKRLFVSILHTTAPWGMHCMKALRFRESLDITGLAAQYRGAVEPVSNLNLAPHARFEALYVKCRK
jgi:hypothetical protein